MKSVPPHASLDVLANRRVRVHMGTAPGSVDRVAMVSDRLTMGRPDPRTRHIPDVDLSDYFSPESPSPVGRTAAISRLHLELTRVARSEGWAYVLRNLSASGGTWLKGSEYLMEPGDELELADGDVFYVGDEQFAIGFRCHLHLDG